MKKILEFESGLKVAWVQNTAVRSVAVGINVGAGASIETPEQSGIAHCIEHMVFKGTDKRTAFDIANDIDCIGAQINAYTSKETTCFYTISLDEHVEECVEILSDIFFNPKFDEGEFERERKVILAEIDENEDSPEDVCYDLMARAFYGAHPLGKTILGTPKTLAELTPNKIREFKRTHYTPKNTFIAVAGNIGEDETRRLIKTYFEDKFDKNASKYAAAEVQRANTLSRAETCKKDIEQAHVGLIFPGCVYKGKEYLTESLMSEIFGGGMSSRLFQSVREKLGLCYTVYSTASAYATNGYFSVYTSTKPQDVEKAVKAIKAETVKFLEDGITQSELQKGKEQYKSALVLGQESTSSTMRSFGRWLRITGELYDIDSRIESIDALSLDDVMATAKRVFDFDKVSTALVSRDVSANVLEIVKS